MNKYDVEIKQHAKSLFEVKVWLQTENGNIFNFTEASSHRGLEAAQAEAIKQVNAAMPM